MQIHTYIHIHTYILASVGKNIATHQEGYIMQIHTYIRTYIHAYTGWEELHDTSRRVYYAIAYIHTHAYTYIHTYTGWEEHRDTSGRVYYANTSTKQTQWNRPS
jgi:hypothetical protein